MKPLTDGSEREVNRDGQPGAALAAIGARHGVSAEKVRPTVSGVANRAYLLGPDLVLRVPRTEAFVADLVKEAAVIPVARAAGVRTPALVTFDDSRTDAAVPYLEGGAAVDGPYAWEARVLRYHLTWALARLRNPAPVPDERHWTAPPASRLLGILRFFASSPPAPWPALT